MAKFTKLTKLLEKLNSDEFGNWKFDEEHKGTADDPSHFPFPIYTEAVHELIKVVLEFVEEHPEYPLHNYLALMEKYGLKRSFQGVDIDSLNDEAVLALLTWVIRGERFCDGMILTNLKKGHVQHLLERLKELDEHSEE